MLLLCHQLVTYSMHGGINLLFVQVSSYTSNPLFWSILSVVLTTDDHSALLDFIVSSEQMLVMDSLLFCFRFIPASVQQIGKNRSSMGSTHGLNSTSR